MAGINETFKEGGIVTKNDNLLTSSKIFFENSL